MKNTTLTKDVLEKIEKESESQVRPNQKAVVTVSPKLRKRIHNLPDPTNPPLGWDDHKAFGAVYPYLKVPALHPKNHGDTVIFNHSDASANRLYLGDNLEVLRTLSSNSIDLIYIDPPFFSGRNYNVIWGDSNEVRTFEDIWEGGINSYLIWLNARLWEIRRVLKKTGSIYVHCDWHASHYIKTLRNYAEKHNLPLELEAIPLDSKEFRARILQRMPDIEENEFFLRFSKPPVIGDIKVKKVGPLEYEFEAIDAFSTNEDGWLVNCQWDFDYQEGHFAADKDYVLSREKKKYKKHGEIFEAVLKAKHKFDKEGEYTIACKIQDNLAGETILSKKVEVEK